MAVNSQIGRGRRSRLYIIIGTALALLAFLAAAFLASAPYLFPASSLGVKVVTAKSSITARTRIDASQLEMTVVNPRPPDSFTSIAAVAGKGARVDIPQGLAVTANLIADAPDILSSSDVTYLPIPSGYVAVTIPTSEQAGVAGYVQVGDRITILASVNTQTFGVSPAVLSVRTVFKDLYVLRVGPVGQQQTTASTSLTVMIRLLQIATALVFALGAFLRFNVSFAVPILAVIGYVLPAIYLRNRRGRRLRMFDDELPRAMELIANSMKAGQSIAQSFTAVTENAGPPVSEEFGLAKREVELGASVESALANMEKRMGSADLRLMIMVVTIQHAVGGDLPAILTTLSDTMRQRREMREEVLAATAQSRASSVIITALPIVVGAFGYFVLPSYFHPLFTNPLGWLILGIAVLLLGTGTFIIRRITTVA